MNEVKGFDELLKLVTKKAKEGLSVSAYEILAGVSKLKYGQFVVKHKEKGCLFEHLHHQRVVFLISIFISKS